MYDQNKDRSNKMVKYEELSIKDVKLILFEGMNPKVARDSKDIHDKSYQVEV